MYDWALNKTKLHFAKEEAGEGATEEQVKAIYVRMAGKLPSEEVKEAPAKKVESEEKTKKVVKKKK